MSAITHTVEFYPETLRGEKSTLKVHRFLVKDCYGQQKIWTEKKKNSTKRDPLKENETANLYFKFTVAKTI